MSMSISIASQQYVTLNTGAQMPTIALGCETARSEEDRVAGKSWMLSGLQVGYRHLDTAHDYGTEGTVARALRESRIPREDVFITTKIPPHHHAKVEASLGESLRNGGFDYYDLYLMHWPIAFANVNEQSIPRHSGPNGEPDGGDFILDDKTTINQTWAGMEKVLETGKVKAIGVSNFSVKTLKELLKTAKVVPAVNQVECHPHQAQPELLDFCKEHGIVLQAYTPTGYGEVAADPVVRRIAEKHGVSPAQVSLAWVIARGTTIVVKSTNGEHQKADLWELPKLDTVDTDALNQLHKDVHYCQYPGPQEKDGIKLALGWTYERLGW